MPCAHPSLRVQRYFRAQGKARSSARASTAAAAAGGAATATTTETAGSAKTSAGTPARNLARRPELKTRGGQVMGSFAWFRCLRGNEACYWTTWKVFCVVASDLGGLCLHTCAVCAQEESLPSPPRSGSKCRGTDPTLYKMLVQFGRYIGPPFSIFRR